MDPYFRQMVGSNSLTQLSWIGGFLINQECLEVVSLPQKFTYSVVLNWWFSNKSRVFRSGILASELINRECLGVVSMPQNLASEQKSLRNSRIPACL
eukprot:1147765-Pelagomonas_calceolata.AAC.7